MPHSARPAWEVHKFGGTSVADAECFRRVADILLSAGSAADTSTANAAGTAPRKAVVVSAMARVTDAWFAAIADAVDGAGDSPDAAFRSRLDGILERHRKLVEELFGAGSTAAQELLERMKSDAADLADLLKAGRIARDISKRTEDRVVGHGELWSAAILTRFLNERAAGGKGKARPWALVDARDVLTVRDGETGPIVDWERSRKDLAGLLPSSDDGANIVITGYIARTPEGLPTTLRRNGSDFSASIFGALLDAKSVSIWTDVDGVLSADPRRVPEAALLDELTYHEAMELAYFGAKVLHPHTMAPLVEKAIPILIRNTFNTAAKGTSIGPRRDASRAAVTEGKVVKGFATVENVSLVNVEGTGMVGVPGVAHRMFGALRDVGVSVILISQGSSEHSICVAVPDSQAGLASETITKTFFSELHHGQIQTVDVLGGCAILAAVGEAMVHTPGVAAKLFRALASAGVSVRAIAQGSSERNISLVVDGADSTRALRAAHAGFFLSEQTLSVGIIGPGLIGATLIGQLHAQAAKLRSTHHVDVRVRAISDSRRMLLDDAGIDLAGWRDALESRSVAADPAAFADFVQPSHLPHAVIIDCTASGEVAARYPEWISRGIHVITPNKKAGSGPLDLYRAVCGRSPGRSGSFHYEATVGAGLPVITTLRDLMRTGDRVLRVEGVLSGTLSFLFNSFSGEKPFSAIVAEARSLGYTEPDPRDDLGGTDVARKLIILARETGLELELADVEVENLVPDGLRSIDNVDQFLARLAEYDGAMEKRRAEAAAKGQRLRYVGVIEGDGAEKMRARVRLQEYPADHAFAGLSGSDNIIAFTTERYREQPLIVRGPGAGPQVTAGGVFGDLLRLAAHLGARV